MLIFVKACCQTMTSTSRPSTNSGPIIGGVVAALILLLVGAAIIWYLLRRRRSRRIRQRSASPVLDSEGITAAPPSKFLPPGAQPMSMAATTQVRLSSRFYPLTGVASLTNLHRLVKLSKNNSQPLVTRPPTPRLPRGQIHPGHL
jgi:hypothetical protein